MIDILTSKPILRVDLQHVTSNTITTTKKLTRNHKRKTTSAVILWFLWCPGGERKRGQHVVQPHLPTTKTEEAKESLRSAPDGGALPAVGQGAYVDAQEMGRHVVSHLGPDA